MVMLDTSDAVGVTFPESGRKNKTVAVGMMAAVVIDSDVGVA